MRISQAFLALAVIGAVACGKKSAAPSPAVVPVVEGGVDGSGGNLHAWSFAGFQEDLKKTHPAVMRDIVHRLILRQNGNGSDIHGLIKRFLGTNPQDMLAKASSQIYYGVEKTCTSSNHPDGDAAYMPDGRICLSWDAFKRFSLDQIIRKEIILSVHELAHAQGFSEDDAKALQNWMERSLGDEIILFQNRYYIQTMDEYDRALANVARALEDLMRRSANVTSTASDAALRACILVNRAQEYDFTFKKLMQRMPKYLGESINDVYGEIMSVAMDCSDDDVQELAPKIVGILQKSELAIAKIAEFDSALCTPGLCEFKFNSLPSGGEVLKRWHVQESYVLNKREYPKFQEPLVECQVKDLSTLEVKTFKSEERWGPIIKEIGDDDYDLAITVRPREDEASVLVQIEHKGAYRVDSKDFTVSSRFWINGYLMRDSNERISARLIQQEIYTDSFESDIFGVPYTQKSQDHFFEPSTNFFAMLAAPKVRKQFNVTCELK